MRAIHVPGQNAILQLPGGTDKNDLPATRIRTYDPELGEGPEQARVGFESVWAPDPDESIRLNCGAPVILTVQGERHPPVSMSVAAVNRDMPRLWLGYDHSTRALGHLSGQLDARAKIEMIAGRQPLPNAPGLLSMWEEALRETAQAPPLEVGALDDRELNDTPAAQPSPADPGTVYLAIKPENIDGVYAFATADDRDRFVSATCGEARVIVDYAPIHDGPGTDELIKAEREANQ